MKTSIHAFAFAAALLGASAAAGAAGLSPTDQFATTHVVFRGDVITQAPRPHSAGAETPTAQPPVQARKPQAPSSYALHSLLVRAPVTPEVVRAQGE
jgi:hypothetical protein